MSNTNFKTPTIIYTHVYQFETCHLVLIAINELNSKKKWQCNLILLPPQPPVFCLGTVLATKMDRLRTSLFRGIVLFKHYTEEKIFFSFMFGGQFRVSIHENPSKNENKCLDLACAFTPRTDCVDA